MAVRYLKHPIRLRAILAISVLTVSLLQAQTATSKVIHHFNNSQAANPKGVVIGPDGNLYGVTNGVSTTRTSFDQVFELTRTPSGRWLETKVFDTVNLGESFPNGGLIFDSAGNIYATINVGPTAVCGCCVCGDVGSVFKLSKNPDGGGWRATKLVQFAATNGAEKAKSRSNEQTSTIVDDTIMSPISGLVRDSAGNLYGAAEGANESLTGAVYKLSPAAGGGWTITDGPFGQGGTGPVTIDSSGNLYGTSDGQVDAPFGIVWKVDTNGTLSTLYTFVNSSKHGSNPIEQGGLVFDPKGNLYGTTQSGGQFDKGTVFELSPNADGTW